LSGQTISPSSYPNPQDYRILTESMLGMEVIIPHFVFSLRSQMRISSDPDKQSFWHSPWLSFNLGGGYTF
jgi:hypothetical protein